METSDSRIQAFYLTRPQNVPSQSDTVDSDCPGLKGDGQAGFYLQCLDSLLPIATSSSLKSPPKPMGLLRTRIEQFHQRTFALARERLGIPCQNTACAVTCYRERAPIADIFGNLAFRRAVEYDELFGIVRFYNSSGWKRWVEFTHFNGDLRLDSFWATQY